MPRACKVMPISRSVPSTKPAKARKNQSLSSVALFSVTFGSAIALSLSLSLVSINADTTAKGDKDCNDYRSDRKLEKLSCNSHLSHQLGATPMSDNDAGDRK